VLSYSTTHRHEVTSIQGLLHVTHLYFHTCAYNAISTKVNILNVSACCWVLAIRNLKIYTSL